MRSKKYKVLLVEDSHVDYYVTESCLAENTDYSFEIEWAETYDKALNMALSDSYDFCLFDYRLGGRNGVDLAKTIDGLGVHSPVFLVSSTGLDKITNLDDAYNIKGYISKLGLNAEKIIDELKDVLCDIDQIDSEFAFSGNIDELRDPVVLFDEDMKFIGSNKAFAGYGFHTKSGDDGLTAADVFNVPELNDVARTAKPITNIFITPLRIHGHVHHKIIWNLIPTDIENEHGARYIAKGVLQKVKWKKTRRKANLWQSLIAKIYNNPSYVNINDNYYHRDLFM